MLTGVPENIIDKIKGLIAMQEGATTEGELRNATSLINKLLTKHNIDLMDVKNHKERDDEDISAEKGAYDDFQTPYEGDFTKDLLETLTYFNLCRLIFHPSMDKTQLRNKGKFTIIGRKTNVAITYYMFDFCIVTLRRIFDKHWEDYKAVIKTNKNPYRRAFYRGAVAGIHAKLQAEQKVSEQEHGVEQMNALVKYNDAALQKKVDELFPKLGKGRKQKPVEDNNALILGYAAGRNMNISKGLTGGDGKNESQFLKDKPKQLGYGG